MSGASDGGTVRPMDEAGFEQALADHQPELLRHCRRLLRSTADAEDAVQETMLRAWRGYPGYEGRASVRTWLHAIATRVCIDAARAGARRPVPTESVAPVAVVDDPADRVADRQATPLAVAALAHLPPRQRAVLVLREVLRWRAAEVADLFGSSGPAVNSSLQRARSALVAVDPDVSRPRPVDEAAPGWFVRYLDAFERGDVTTLVAAARDDALPVAS